VDKSVNEDHQSKENILVWEAVLWSEAPADSKIITSPWTRRTEDTKKE